MGITATILLSGLVIGYLIIERAFVIPPIFLPVYIFLSAIAVIITI